MRGRKLKANIGVYVDVMGWRGSISGIQHHGKENTKDAGVWGGRSLKTPHAEPMHTLG